MSVLIQSINCEFAASNRFVLHVTQRFTDYSIVTTQRFTDYSIVTSAKHARSSFTLHPAAAAASTAARSSSAAWSFLRIYNELLDVVLFMLGGHQCTCGSAHLLQLTLNKGGGRRGLSTQGVTDCGATEATTTAAAPAQRETCFQASLQGCVCSAAAAGAHCAGSPDDFNDSVVVVIILKKVIAMMKTTMIV